MTIFKTRHRSPLDLAIAVSLIAMVAMNLFVLAQQAQPMAVIAAATSASEQAA